MTTISQLADGIRTRLATVAGLHPYATMVELPHEPAAEVLFDGRDRSDAGGGQVARFVVELSCSSQDRGWDEAIDLVRAYADPLGSASVEGALYADESLGGIAHWLAVTAVEGERRVQWGDGWRMVVRVRVAVGYDP